jgi:hypothetical protein
MERARADPGSDEGQNPRINIFAERPDVVDIRMERLRERLAELSNEYLRQARSAFNALIATAFLGPVAQAASIALVLDGLFIPAAIAAAAGWTSHVGAFILLQVHRKANIRLDTMFRLSSYAALVHLDPDVQTRQEAAKELRTMIRQTGRERETSAGLSA